MQDSTEHGPFLTFGLNNALRYLLTGLGLFFAFGLATGTIESGSGPSKRREPQVVSLVIGGAVAFVVFLVFRVTGPVVLDLGRRTVTLPRQNPFAADRREASLDEFTSVALRKKVMRSRRPAGASSNAKESSVVYALHLAGGAGAALELRTYVDYPAARQMAEEVAEFLHLPLVDSAAEATTTRGPAELNETYVNRIRRKAVRPLLADGAWQGRIGVRRDGEGARYTLPKKPVVDVVEKVFFDIVMVAIVLVALLMVGHMCLPRVAVYVFAGFISLVLLANIIYSREETFVQASTNGLRITRQYRWLADEQRIDVDHLEELDCVADGLLARSDQIAVTFGETLTYAERNWLHNALTRDLLGEPPPAEPSAAEGKKRSKRRPRGEPRSEG